MQPPLSSDVPGLLGPQEGTPLKKENIQADTYPRKKSSTDRRPSKQSRGNAQSNRDHLAWEEERLHAGTAGTAHREVGSAHRSSLKVSSTTMTTGSL